MTEQGLAQGRSRRRTIAAAFGTMLFGGVALGLLIAPSLAHSSGTPALIKLLKKKGSDDAIAPTIFRHWKHQKRFKCFTCHPTVFSTTERQRMTHKAMKKGKFCGACHDGTIAFAHNSRKVECEVCHAE